MVALAAPNAILRIRARIVKAIRDWFDNNGFLLVDTPMLTPSACEGTTTLFETDYFGVPAYLTQSGQLYNEANAMAFGKVYCFGSTFRAEKSKTRRHLTEFWMVGPEWAYGTLDDYMNVGEEFVSYVVQTVLSERAEEFKILERDTSRLEKVIAAFPKISYTEAVDILHRDGFPDFHGAMILARHTRRSSAKFDKPVFVHRYPTEIKAFYMAPDPTNPQVVPGRICSHPKDTAKSSAAANVRLTWLISKSKSKNTNCRAR